MIKPMCCGLESLWVDNGPSLQYFFCGECRKEVVPVAEDKPTDCPGITYDTITVGIMDLFKSGLLDLTSTEALKIIQEPPMQLEFNFDPAAISDSINAAFKNAYADVVEPQMPYVGQATTTSKGFVFVVTDVSHPDGLVWKDVTTGAVWYPRERLKYTHYQAVEKFGTTLPTMEEFEEAEKHGIREIMSDFEGYYFWSSSLNPKDSGDARQFDGNDGDDFYDYRYNVDSVRCVGRRALKV